jgi:hypothetical protein
VSVAELLDGVDGLEARLSPLSRAIEHENRSVTPVEVEERVRLAWTKHCDIRDVVEPHSRGAATVSTCTTSPSTKRSSTRSATPHLSRIHFDGSNLPVTSASTIVLTVNCGNRFGILAIGLTSRFSGGAERRPL